MNIGSVRLEDPTVLAPLAGITNLPFRLLARQSGAALVCSEMVSANGLCHGSVKTVKMLETAAEERPVSFQIFGADPAIMARAARMVADAGASVLDINFGCSVKKVVKTGAGAALMRAPDQAAAVIGAVRDAVDIPLTIKIRTGWEKSGAQAFAIAEMAQRIGVNAIAVHPRTASQGFSGCADWRLIRALKQRLAVPVIGNGDIVAAQDAVRMMADTGCDAVMVGRAAIGNPWIFEQIRALIDGRPVPTIDISRRRQTMMDFLHDTVRHFGEKHACLMMRSRLGWFVKGLPHCSRFREAIKHIRTEKEAAAFIDAYTTER